MTGEINKLRQLLCEEPTPELKSKVCALCLNDMMWDYAESVIPGLKEWTDRQYEIALNLEKHGRRNDEGEVYSECRFKMKNLEGADLRDADLTRAYLRGADLSSADLYGVNLYGANLYGANLYGANLYGANLSGANLSYARYSADTRFPEGFSPSERDMVEVEG